MTDGYAWRGNWNSATLYNPGDLALYGGVIYICITSHSSVAIFDTSLGNWAIYLSANNWRSAWTPATRYGIGDIVRYNGIVYRCIVGHTSSTTTLGLEIGNNDNEDDSVSELWQIYYEGIEYKGTWTATTRYRRNDLVKYGGSILRCVTGHVAGSNITNANFVTEFSGFNFYQNWSNAVYYAIGDIVRYGGYLYISATNHTNSSSITEDTVNWNVLSKATDFMGTWSAATDYKVGDVVRRGGNLYIALADTVNDGSSLDYLDSSNWELVNVAQTFRGNWTAGTSYSLNELVVFKGNTYKATVEHIAANANFPGDNGEGINYWDLVIQAGSEVGMSQRGDLLTFDLSRSGVGDGSTFGLTNVPVGSETQVVIANQEGSVDYAYWGDVARVRYVDIDGVDDYTNPERGTSQFLPWRTIRFACEQVNDGYTGHTTIKVAVGEYTEPSQE
jgi:hypothetical protein